MLSAISAESENIMKEIKALLKVKSLITLSVIGVFVALALQDKIDPAVTSSVITAVITYYFTKDTNTITTKESIKNQDASI